MLGAPKPFASLSSGLLARKGGARPAMRPQGYASLAPTAQQLEDLGWDDMGQDAPDQSVATLVPSPAAPVVPVTPAVEIAADAEAEKPSVLVLREALAHTLEAPVAPTAEAVETPQIVNSVSVATATRLSRETAHKGRAAFTLRLDADRHLRLRLASALANQSAQQLVAHALDRFIASMPEVDALAAQLPPQMLKAKGKRR